MTFVRGSITTILFCVAGALVSIGTATRALAENPCDSWPLAYLAASGNYESVEACLKAGTDPNERSGGGAPAFFAAVEHPQILELMLRHGARSDATDERGTTALIVAASRGVSQSVASLLASSAPIDHQADDGTTALMAAVESGSLPAVAMLTKAGADPNLGRHDATPNSAHLPLLAASARGDLAIVEALMTAGAVLEGANDGCQTPLFFAVGGNHRDVVRRLTASGAAPNVRACLYNHWCGTPLQYAKSLGYGEIVDTIVSLGTRTAEHPAAHCSVELDAMTVGDVSVDYSPARFARADSAELLQVRERAVAELAPRRQVLEEAARQAGQRLFTLQSRLLELEELRKTSLRETARAGLESGNAAYRRLWEGIERAQGRLRKIEQRIAVIPRSGPSAAPDRVLALVEEADRLDDELVRQQGELRRLENDPAVRAAIEAVRARVAGREREYWSLRREILAARNELVSHEAGWRQLGEDFLKASREYDEALAEHHALASGRLPIVTRVGNDDFEVVVWHPEALLEELRRHRDFLAEKLREADRRRSEARMSLLRASYESDLQAERLIESIYHSHLAQFGVEVAALAKDIVEANGKGGPPAMLATAVSKLVQTAVFGGPTYYDAQVDPIRPLEVLGDPVGMATVQAGKTGIGHAAEIALMDYMERGETEGFLKTFTSLISAEASAAGAEGAAAGAERAGSVSLQRLRNDISDRLEGLAEARAGLAAATGRDGWRPLGKSIAGSFLKDLSWDVASTEAKRTLAEWIEGPQMQRYMSVQARLQGEAILFMRTSGLYWELYDAYEDARAKYAAALENYDASKSQYVVRNERRAFTERYRPFEIRLAVQAGGGSGHEFEVEVGGVRAEGDGPGSLVFRIPPGRVDEIARDADGNTSIQVRLLR